MLIQSHPVLFPSGAASHSAFASSLASLSVCVLLCLSRRASEPKSGTSFMFEWAKVVLKHTCDHLQDMYGPESCRTEEIGEKETQVNMIFEPSLATDASCTCEAIER